MGERIGSVAKVMEKEVRREFEKARAREADVGGRLT